VLKRREEEKGLATFVIGTVTGQASLDVSDQEALR
jgi:hypothetical protein